MINLIYGTRQGSVVDMDWSDTAESYIDNWFGQDTYRDIANGYDQLKDFDPYLHQHAASFAIEGIGGRSHIKAQLGNAYLPYKVGKAAIAYANPTAGVAVSGAEFLAEQYLSWTE